MSKLLKLMNYQMMLTEPTTMSNTTLKLAYDENYVKTDENDVKSKQLKRILKLRKSMSRSQISMYKLPKGCENYG